MSIGYLLWISSLIVICKEILRHLVNGYREINISNETVYHGRQDDAQSVHSLYGVIERDMKLKRGWKVLVVGRHQCGTVFAEANIGSPD